MSQKGVSSFRKYNLKLKFKSLKIKDWCESVNNLASGNGPPPPETDMLVPHPAANGASGIRRNRKDSFRIVNIVDTPNTLRFINEHDELLVEENQASVSDRNSTLPLAATARGLCQRPRIGSVDSGTIHGFSRTHSRSTSISSVDLTKNNVLPGNGPKMNSGAAWKQLNDGLNHLFPGQSNKKSSLPNTNKNPNTLGPQNLRPELQLRKSSSRSSLYDPSTSDLEFEAANEDIIQDQRYHTVTGTSATNRKNTLVTLPGSVPHPLMQSGRNTPLNLPPAGLPEGGGGLMMRRRNGEVDGPLFNADQLRSLTTSPYPWQATESTNLRPQINGHPPHPQAHPIRTPTEISEAIRILDESHKQQMTELRMRMDALHREYSREQEAYSRDRQELRTKLQQALCSQEVVSDPVNMPLPGLYPQSRDYSSMTPMMGPAGSSAGVSMPGNSGMASGSSGSTGQTSYPPMPGFPMPTSTTGGQQTTAALPFPASTGSSFSLDNTSTMTMEAAAAPGVQPEMMGGLGQPTQASAALPQQTQQQLANQPMPSGSSAGSTGQTSYQANQPMPSGSSAASTGGQTSYQANQPMPAVTTSGSIPIGHSGSNPGLTPLQYAAVLPGSRYQIQVNPDGSHQVIHVQQPPNAGSLTVAPTTVAPSMGAPGAMPSGSSVASTGGQTSYPPTNS